MIKLLRREADILSPGVFRFVLAGAVVISHISRFDIGRMAVLLFFYLSGYWTAVIWDRKFEGRDTLRFYAARYLRIAPLYLLVLVGSSLLRHLPITPTNILLLGVASSGNDPIGVSWSLDVELQFYLLLPLIARLVKAAPALLVIAVSVLLGALGCWLQSRFGMMTVVKFLPVFVLGALTHAKAWKPEVGHARLSLLAFVAASALTALTPFISKTSRQPFDQDIYSFFWILPLLPYIARSLHVRSTPSDRHLGNLSYPLYLLHFPLIAASKVAFGDSMAVRLAAVAVALVGTLVLYIFVDRPVDRWRVRLTEGKSRGAARAGA